METDLQVNRNKALIATTVTKIDNKEVLAKFDIAIGEMQKNIGKQKNQKSQEHQVNPIMKANGTLHQSQSW